ncbi:hypothetical protein [Accumulibacter sp.]|uniref:hypothetical protein n=1 Tax=Accumulibacter sp. TaxID=2053492 RepID=UPI0025FC984B|nr:hypothetical protein [Accumulibacter sp.]MCM8612497.1 hypothetical protein [Accumulibacter sp.]MCM8636390.1 hypothetical protein [Accumulibacter sp.]MCM8640080.1 hypothetical protein [Accumulibacter sp.]
MRTKTSALLPLAAALASAGIVPVAMAAPVSYEMTLSTHSGFAGGGGMSGMLGMMSGRGGSVSRMMDLRLTSPVDLAGGAAAEHIVPEAMRIGPVLPLRGERRGKGEGSAADDQGGKLLLYWGCSASVPAGQPEVIDLRTLDSRVSPEVAAMARHSRQGKGGADGGESLPPRTLWWPQGDPSGGSVPADASAVGEHLVRTSFMPQEIRYALDQQMDFLEPMHLRAGSGSLSAAIPLQWAALARARGYNLNAVGAANEREVIIWMASRNQPPMLPSSQNTCTIPAGIFAKTQGAMLMGEALGPTRSFAHPPQKAGERKPPIWTARVRVNSFDAALLGMGDMGREAAGDAAADSLVPGGATIMKGLKGLFGN